jgi:hypothetical protein
MAVKKGKKGTKLTIKKLSSSKTLGGGFRPKG